MATMLHRQTEQYHSDVGLCSRHICAAQFPTITSGVQVDSTETHTQLEYNIILCAIDWSHST